MFGVPSANFNRPSSSSKIELLTRVRRYQKTTTHSLVKLNRNPFGRRRTSYSNSKYTGSSDNILPPLSVTKAKYITHGWTGVRILERIFKGALEQYNELWKEPRKQLYKEP